MVMEYETSVCTEFCHYCLRLSADANERFVSVPLPSSAVKVILKQI